HFRVELDTKKNKKTGVSQHELLYRLSKNKSAFVYYACPMVFDKTDLYEIDIDLDQLQLVDLLSCQDIYGDNDNHYIYFDDSNAVPICRSEPIVGRAINPKDFVVMLTEKFAHAEPEDSRAALWDLLTDVQSLGISEEARICEG